MVKLYARHTVYLDISAFAAYVRLTLDKSLSAGDSITAFEKEFGKFTGAASCVAASSAQAGLYVTLKAMGAGPAREVIMPAFGFPAMAAAVVATGARPVFVDADPVTFTMDPKLAAAAVTDKTAAIIATHLFGRAAAVEELAQLAADKDVYLIEDCSQAGGAFKGGVRLGSFGDAAIFSFDTRGNMPCFGGGAVCFKDRDLSGKVRRQVNSSPAPDDSAVHRKVLASVPAWIATKRHVAPWTLVVAARVLDTAGSRLMDGAFAAAPDKAARFSMRVLGRTANLYAAVGLQQLEKLPKRNATLARNGKYLADALAGIQGVRPPEALEGEEHVYAPFTIVVPEPARFRTLLLKKGIDTRARVAANCASLDAFGLFAAVCPVAQDLATNSIGLPNNTRLSRGDLDYIAATVRDVAAALAQPAGGQ